MATQIIVTGISKTDLEELKSHWDRFANCYFWSPPGNASSRRAEESKHYRSVEFHADGHLVSVEISVSCSCKNYYCTRHVTVSGIKKAQGGRYLRTLIEKGIFVDEAAA